MKKDLRNKPYLAPNELAELLMVSPVTVRHWANKGWIKAVLTPGGHRRFVREEVEKFARARGLSLEPPSDGTLRVLVVDDEPDVCSGICELLEALPERTATETANGGFEAGMAVHSFRPHIVLLDLMMPEMDGFEVCRKLRAHPATEAVRVIAMTGYYSEENARRIISAGAERCLRKPIDPDELVEALGLEGERAKVGTRKARATR